MFWWIGGSLVTIWLILKVVCMLVYVPSSMQAANSKRDYVYAALLYAGLLLFLVWMSES